MNMPVERTEQRHVLVADDDDDIRELFAEFIRVQGFTVASVRDGRAAVTELERSPGIYSVIFTDFAMPGADGFTVLRAARSANPSSYIVIVTGYASIDTAVQAVREGANDYLAKPCSLGQIDIALQRAGDHLKLSHYQRLIEQSAGLEQRLRRIEGGLERLMGRLDTLLPPS
jgi:two-component system response regulator PilR (NtrC family)